MDTILMIAVVLITLAVIAQAGVLIAMYLMSRRLATKAEALMNDSQRLMAPLETITGNLKTVSDDLTETGKIARQQVVYVQQMVAETQQNVREHVAEIRATVLDTVDEARGVIMRPIRQYSAIATGIAEGFRTFFGGRREEPTTVEAIITIEEEHPAA